MSITRWATADNEVTSTGAATTFGQLGALAAGATVARCGANSAMQRIMGRGLATSLVRTLWFDWVRPTIKVFLLQVSCVHDGTTGVPSTAYRAVSFALSPLLLSVAGTSSSHGPGPTLVPLQYGRLFDGRRVAHITNGQYTQQPWDGFELSVWDPVVPRTPWVTCARGDTPGKDYEWCLVVVVVVVVAVMAMVIVEMVATIPVDHIVESTGISTLIHRNVVDVFRVSDSLFCVSFQTNKQQEWFRFYHRDQPTVPLDVLQELKRNKTKHRGKHVRRFMAVSGFVFNVFANMVDVIDPTTGFVILTITFPDFSSINLTSPFSCFLSHESKR
ncbi:hypothetical protein Pelo_4872 [Pelomyxa schiedti]|nr:hypothetical protein Pelo_4872 [Pelomyxa schiedti]